MTSIDDVIKRIGTPNELTEKQVQEIIATGVQCSLFNGDTSKKVIFAFRNKVYVKERREGANYILLTPTDDWTKGEY